MARVTTRDRNKGKVYKDGRPKPPNWEYRFPIASVNGKRQHSSQAGFKTQKEAAEAGTKAMAEYLGTGDAFKPEKISYSDVLDLWLKNHVRANLKGQTVASYEVIVKNHIRPALGHFFITRLRPLDLQNFLHELAKKGYATGYITKAHIILKGSLKYAVEPCQYIKQNPMLYVSTVKGSAERKKEIISKEDFKRILERFPEGHHFYTPLMIAYHTGLRRGEVLGLTWDNIDFEAKTLTVEKQQQLFNCYTDRQLAIGTPKSKASQRTIAIGETLLTALKREKLRQKENRLRYGRYYYKYGYREIKSELNEIVEDKNGDLDFICVKESGQILTPTALKHLSRVINKQLNIRFEFHALRHTHATMLVESGANVKGVQQRLGHDHVKTTLQLYAKTTESIIQDTISIFEEALK